MKMQITPEWLKSMIKIEEETGIEVGCGLVVCKKCQDEHYMLVGCCSGHECGCMGQPVSMSNCVQCNKNEDKPMGNYIKQYVEHVEYIKK
jgi:hypothetical protein